MAKMVRTWAFITMDPGLIPSQRTKIPRASRRGQKKKERKKEIVIVQYYLSYRCTV